VRLRKVKKDEEILLAVEEPGGGKKEMIKTIISDVGNVLLFFDHKILTEGFAKHSDLSSREIHERFLWSEIDNDFQMGKITPFNFYKKTSKLLGMSISYDEFRKVYTDVLILQNDAMVEFLKTLKGKYRLIMLSDTNRIHTDFVKKKFSFHEIFDGYVLSYEVGHSKHSNPKNIFSIAAKMAKSKPGECLFIDDMKENVEKARDFGFQAIQYTDMESFIREMIRLGIDF
jgi:HAD superfamily hydrolase (TIGR01509 family)